MNSNSSAIVVPPPAKATVAVTNDIRDIKPPVPIPNTLAWLGLVLLAMVLFSAAVTAFALWRRKRVKLPPIPVIPPHVRAKNKLAGALAFLQDPRQFCTLVSDTVRIYLEERFDFHAPERTTEEFLTELKSTNLLNVDQKQRLAEFLERCDLVKFAKFEPTENELRALLDAALRLVDETGLHFASQAVAAAPPPPVSVNGPPPIPMQVIVRPIPQVPAISPAPTAPDSK